MKRCQNCEFLSIFLKEGSNKYIKLLYKMETVREIRKRRIRREVFCKKGVLENLTKFTGKTFVGVSFLIKLQASDLNLYFKKRVQCRCFPLNLVKFFKNSFFKSRSAGCFRTKDLFLPIFSKEKSFKQIFFQLTGLTRII